MEITINGQQIDFTLENEKTLGEIVQGIHSWLQNGGFFITSLLIDSSEYQLDQSGQWSAEPLEKYSTIDIVAKNTRELQIEQHDTVFQFFHLMNNALQAGNIHLVKEVIANREYIDQNIDFIIEKSQTSRIFAEQMNSVFLQSGITGTDIPGEIDKDILIPFLQNMELITGERLREYLQPISELKTTAEKLKEIIPQISDVSIMLQTGKDNEAMSSVVLFTELSSKLIRLYPIVNMAEEGDISAIILDDLSFTDFYADFNKILGELLAAFTDEDSILIGDLLEYEIVPRLEVLLQFINQLEATYRETRKGV